MEEDIKKEPEEYSASECDFQINEFVEVDIIEDRKPLQLVFPGSKPESQDEHYGDTADQSSQECENSFQYEDSTTKNESFNNILSAAEKFMCKLCNKSFTIKGHLNRHMRIHTGDRPFKCDICNKTFSVNCNLKIHLRTHTGDKPYKCSVCGMPFAMKGHLNRHMRSHTGDKPYRCNVCLKSFSEKSYLDIHGRIHTGFRPFICNVCYKSFSQKSKINNHLRTHTGPEPFECDVCKISIPDKNHINIHMHVHNSDEEQYNCSICEFKSDVIRARLAKKLKCNVCCKVFSETRRLNRHLRVHTGAKPFMCDHCRKCFTEKGNLSKHMRIHSREMQSCDFG